LHVASLDSQEESLLSFPAHLGPSASEERLDMFFGHRSAGSALCTVEERISLAFRRVQGGF